MSDGGKAAAGLRERLTTGTEDKLGKALADLFENPLITGTIGRAFDARGRAAQAQELALSALNIPTAADIERLTRRLRSVSQRLEGIEDGVHRINRALTDGAVERRLSAVEGQLKTLSGKLGRTAKASEASRVSGTAKASGAGKASGTGKASGAGKASGRAKASRGSTVSGAAPKRPARGSAAKKRA